MPKPAIDSPDNIKMAGAHGQTTNLLDKGAITVVSSKDHR
jgi:hypothetical protein